MALGLLQWSHSTAREEEGEEDGDGEMQSGTREDGQPEQLNSDSDPDSYFDTVDFGNTSTPATTTGEGKEQAHGPFTPLMPVLEDELGKPLRRCPPLRANRVGIRVGKRVRWVRLGG